MEDKSMKQESLGTHQKALGINLDGSKYGTFAEIGAGQEVARWFFRVGGASGTIAKTISAYDMTVSDAIYGQSPRYVSRRRLKEMLDHEYRLVVERLDEKRGARTKFFVFADTVAAQSYARREECHGWMGVRFQGRPRSAPSQIIIHVRMLDAENLQQQEALGVMGVNLVYGTFYFHSDPELLIRSLRDNLTSERVEVDMIEFSGPEFEQVDNRLMSLRLVEYGLTEAAMFKASGEVVQPSEVLHKKAILVERGSFRPVTNATMDMLECAQAQFVQEPQVQGEEVVVLMEMTLTNLSAGGAIDYQDFLARVDLLSALGRTVLISNFGEYYRLAAHLFRYTKKMIGLVMGVPTLREVFNEKYYEHLEGGILESFGRLFKNALKLYVYPSQDKATGVIIRAENLQVEPHLRHLHAHLIENRFIESIRGYDKACLPIFAKDVLEKIAAGDNAWESLVPGPVAKIIHERNLFQAGEEALKKETVGA